MSKDIIRKAGEKLSRMNGLQLGGAGLSAGISWVPPVDEQRVIRNLFIDLADRRVLFVDHAMEMADETITSVVHIRGLITDRMKCLPERSKATKLLDKMRRACLRYLNNRRLGESMTDMGEALDDLRAVFGACLLVLSKVYDLTVLPDLETILPDPQYFEELKRILG